MAKTQDIYNDEINKTAVEVTPLSKINLNVFGENNYATPLFEIIGSDSQVLEVNLPPGNKIYTEPGTLLHMSEHIKKNIGAGGVFRAATRALVAGESFFRLNFSNETNEPQSLGLTPNFPSKIIPIDLNVYSEITIKSSAFFCALNEDTRISYRLAPNVATACCANHGIILNTLRGTGIAFLNASGTILSKNLEEGEVMLVDSYSLVAFTNTVSYDVRRTGGCLMCCCGGEGCFNVVLRGPGLIILQSMPFEKLAALVFPHGNNGSGGGGGDGGGGE